MQRQRLGVWMLWAVLWSLGVAGCGGDFAEGESGKSEVLAQGSDWLRADSADERSGASALVLSTVPKAISAGNFHSLALRTDGSVWAWGLNSDGQLGNGSLTNSSLPLQVAGLPVIKAIAAGKSHSLALGVDGSVWAWGQNSFGQLGDGTTTRRLVPVAVAIPGGAVAIAGGLNHSLAVATDGSVYTWGTNTYGQLGDGTTTTRLTPVRINLPVSVRAVSAGWYHSLAVGTNGQVWTWGRNLNGQIGNGTASTSNQLTPYHVSLLQEATAIAAGANHSMALLANQSVMVWGQNTNGQIGNGTTATAQPVPVLAGLPGPMVAISAGGNFSLAIDSSGAVWAWGQNTSGQLGDGTTTQHALPMPVLGLNDAVAVSGGLFHSMALRPGCPFWAWGQNSSGQLGDGTLINRRTITQTQLLNIYFFDLEGDGYGADLLPPEEACQSPGVEYVENGLDCNDFDPFVNPSASEICDGLDNDCDTVADEEAGDFFHRDADVDGYGDPGDSVQACGQPEGRVLDGTDCNDTNANVHPEAAEVCNGVDDDCSGTADEGVGPTWYQDADRDGYGDGVQSTQACSAPAGYVPIAGDCNDNDASVRPGATETCNGVDDNCSGAADEGNPGGTLSCPTGGLGVCGEGITYCTGGTIHCVPIYGPSAEICDGRDNDCDGQTDEDVSMGTYYWDADGDGYGNGAVSTQACSAPGGYVTNSGDCDDGNASVRPSATETCNSVDDNCNGSTDEGVGNTYYRDVDGDGYGNGAVTTVACSAPAGYVTNSSDCNDGSSNVRPGATETCNGVDDNCNGSTDEGVGNTYYRDTDGDGYGNGAVSTLACSAPAGYVANSSDCNDGSASVRPGATETCNSVDDNCNGSTDEGVGNTWHRDADGDGYGNGAVSTQACAAPAGYVTNSSDCNDSNSNVRPGATETCNSVDDNCNGSTDEGVGNTYYRDTDGDGYGNGAVSTLACSAPAGYVANSSDCNDGSASVRPGATETCNSVDDNCNGSTDEGVGNTYYRDADGDGYGNGAVSTQACAAPAGYVTNSADCNDGRVNVKPGGVEWCDGLDNDCDSLTDEACQDHPNPDQCPNQGACQ